MCNEIFIFEIIILNERGLWLWVIWLSSFILIYLLFDLQYFLRTFFMIWKYNRGIIMGFDRITSLQLIIVSLITIWLSSLNTHPLLSRRFFLILWQLKFSSLIFIWIRIHIISIVWWPTILSCKKLRSFIELRFYFLHLRMNLFKYFL